MNSETKVLIIFSTTLVFIIVGGLFLNSQIKIEKEDIVITTDKTEYEQGETVKIIFKNNSDKNLFIDYPDVERFENNQWVSIRGGVIWSGCEAIGGMPYLSVDYLDTEYQWDQKEKWCDMDNNAHFQKVTAGKYRIESRIIDRTKSETEDPNNISGLPTKRYFYSNEFTIKEKQEVAITTDKTEYGRGESVNITFSHSSEPIYVEFGTGYTFYQLKGDVWEKLTTGCETNCVMTCEGGILKRGPCLLYEMPPYLFSEYNGPWEIQWNQKECIYETKLCGGKNYTEGSLNQASAGKFKVEFCYFDKGDIDLSTPPGNAPQDKKKCIEKEFTIKEKPAIDPRCNQKITKNGSPVICKGFQTSYEFDVNTGKCIGKKTPACGYEIPFNSLEECQKVCEISVGKELPFETIENVNWSGIGEKKNYVIKNKEDWQNVWAKAGHSAIAPEIDFTKEMIIAAFYGVAMTGGYNIEITKIIESADKLEVFVKETSPGKGCIVTQAATEPRHIIKLQKSDKEVIFKIENEVTVCK